jgi:hypothetical protein
MRIVWYDTNTNMKTAVITLKEYQGFQRAYDFFNRELFAGSLPQVLVTLQRHANTRGYFSPDRFNQNRHPITATPVKSVCSAVIATSLRQ